MSAAALNRIQSLHAWYCGVMGIELALNMAFERYWFDWLAAGYNGPQLRKVIIYLRKEIRRDKRNPGALKLANLLDPENFANDLLLASHNLSADNKVPKLPESEVETGLTKLNRIAGEKKAPPASPVHPVNPPVSLSDPIAALRKAVQ